MSFEKYINYIKNWGNEEDSIKAIILVGSYARGTNSSTSDIDLCILTTEKPKFIANPNIFSRFGEINKHQIEYYGAVTSVRIWYKKSFEVEYSIAEPSWILTPLDDGTRRVLKDGYKVIVDKCGYFENLTL